MATEAGGEGNASVLVWAAMTVGKHVKKVAVAIKKDLTEGSGPAIGREAVNDVRNSMHQVFFGQGEGQSQPGTPMQPLQSEVAESRRADARMDAGEKDPASVSVGRERGKAGTVYGAKQRPAARRPSPAEIAASTQLYRPKREEGNGQEQSESKGQERGKGR